MLSLSNVWPLTVKNAWILGFPGGSVVKNLPANAGDMGSSPGLGRAHMPQSNKACAPQLLSPGATTTEAHVPRGCVPQQENHCNEKPTHHNEV